MQIVTVGGFQTVPLIGRLLVRSGRTFSSASPAFSAYGSKYGSSPHEFTDTGILIRISRKTGTQPNDGQDDVVVRGGFTLPNPFVHPPATTLWFAPIIDS